MQEIRRIIRALGSALYALADGRGALEATGDQP